MNAQHRPAACERARVWAALRPDGELSLFEQRLLEAHCTRCADCRHLLESVESVTEAVRVTPAETMTRPVRVMRARPSHWRGAYGIVASGGAAAVALVLAFWVGPQHASQSPTSVVNTPVIVFTPQGPTSDVKRIWQLKRHRVDATSNPSDAHRTGPVLA